MTTTDIFLFCRLLGRPLEIFLDTSINNVYKQTIVYVYQLMPLFYGVQLLPFQGLKSSCFNNNKKVAYYTANTFPVMKTALFNVPTHTIFLQL